MDCRTARSLLDLARPQSGEMHAAEADALDQHLNSCPECDALFRQERHIEAHVGRAVRLVPEPRGLRQMILDRLSYERRVWLRRLALKAAGFASAAAVLLSLGVWSMGWLAGPLAKVFLTEIQEEARDKHLRASNPESVAEWFVTHRKTSIEPPVDVAGGRILNYNLLAEYDLKSFQGGKQAPMLLFAKNDLRLQVWVLSGQRFDLAQLHEQPPPAPSLGWKTEVIFAPSGSQTPQWAYVLVYTDSGEGLKPFLNDNALGSPPG
jgi:uncharacterized C2H2 Zn-finger protein